MRKSWAMAVSVALAGCGAEFAAVEETIVDGGEDAVELEGGVQGGTSAASSGGAIRVTSGGAIVSAHPRVARVSEPTTKPMPAASHIADVMELPESSLRGGMVVAAAWTKEADVAQLIAFHDVVAWGSGNRLSNEFVVASLEDGNILKKRELTGCSPAASRVTGSLFALCGELGNEVVALDPRTLEERWRRTLDHQVVTLAAGSDVVLVSLREARPNGWQEVVALGAGEGDVRWHSRLPSNNVDLRSDGDQLFAFERDPTVWALDVDTGHVRWSRKSDKAIYDVVPIRESLTAVIGQESLWLLDDGRDVASRAKDVRSISEIAWPWLYSCDDKGDLHAVNLDSGQEAWRAHVTVEGSTCAVFPGETVFVQAADHLMALDTTQPAARAKPVTIRGRFKDVIGAKESVRNHLVWIGERRVRTDAHGRFVATVRAHGPISVSLADVSGPGSHAVVWPDAGSHQRVELTNDYYEDCH
jgi:outer membrane protein assembly factor BamB